MVTQRFVTIGRIKKSIGTHGQVLADCNAGVSVCNLIGTTIWVTPPPSVWRSGVVTDAREQGDGVVLTIEGLVSIDEAKQLVGTHLVVAVEDVDESWVLLTEDAPEIRGLQVRDARYGDLGTVQDIIVTGANDVWVVDGPYGEVLIPVIDDVCIAQDETTATVHIPNGLIDEEPPSCA
ncbi:MAG: hypothetical protein FWG78_02385 [Coriobacteriia bacterium]|nr:hypothetical protein [Coriobacteriia bacterium]